MATSRVPQSGGVCHSYLAQVGHSNFALTPEIRIRKIMELESVFDGSVGSCKPNLFRREAERGRLDEISAAGRHQIAKERQSLFDLRRCGETFARMRATAG